MDVILQIKSLTKKYRKFTVVDNLDLTIKKGQIFGVLGPNGSGKTTTLGMLLGVINQTSGSYSWFGKADFENCRKRIGSILEHPIFYPDLSAYANLKIAAKIKNCGIDRIDFVLERVGLLERKNSKFNTFSLGMKQRLALASALLSNPEVLVLDEPTNGLDPMGINQMRELILSIANEGKTIIISSHLLDEIQKMCTHVAILKNGKLIKVGDINEIMSSKNTFELKINGDINKLKNTIEQIDGFIQATVKNKMLLASFKTSISAEFINKTMFNQGVTLTHITKHNTSLEDEFIKIVKS